jgi:hypothetical protein
MVGGSIASHPMYPMYYFCNFFVFIYVKGLSHPHSYSVKEIFAKTLFYGRDKDRDRERVVGSYSSIN